MGFTRFWKQPHGISPLAWGAIIADTSALLASIDVPLVGGVGEVQEEQDVTPGLPLFSDDEIAFNGVGPDSSEWFVLRPALSDFECVKTYGRPYDFVVGAVLIIAKHHAPTEILNVTSDDGEDGDHWDAWKPALEMCTAAGVTISRESVKRLKRDISYRSKEYEPPKSREEVELDKEWERMWKENLLKMFCEQRFPPTYLRYQATERLTPSGVRLKLRRSIDARPIAPTSPILRQKVDELQNAWNETHRLRIVEIEIS